MAKTIWAYTLASIAGVASAAVLSPAAFATALSTPPSVVVFDQAVAGKSVDVSYVFLPAKGYVAVYPSDANGQPIRQALGTATLNAGDHRNVKISLNEQPKPGQRLWISIYGDTDGKPGFDAKADTPIWPTLLPSENAFIAR